MQANWRGFCARREAARRRAALAAAAVALQAAWRARLARRSLTERAVAAAVLQRAARCAVARRALHAARVVAFARARAARAIQRAFRAYRAARWTLAPLRLPQMGTPAAPLDGSALLALQLRLRSAVDARTAPELTTPGLPGASCRRYSALST